MSDHIDTLKTLHTALIDSRNGYQEALDDAEGKGLTPLFEKMIALRDTDAAELAQHLTQLGEPVDNEGSFMSTVHRTVISIRAVLTGLNHSILPALIDGEERIIGYYDDAIHDFQHGSSEHATLIRQRTALKSTVADLKLRKEMAA
jgi:uncharacterized protein (TIGR02284 family)